jgi:S-adenosyl methyltransferase
MEDGVDPRLASRIDSTKAHPARRYNYWLGGKDNFRADRESGDELERLYPTIRVGVLENRAFLQRTVRFLAAEAGIRQFLDIGTGLPTADNTHEVAQRVAADSRIVYVDNDPLVLTHARALLTSNEQGATAYIEADLREPDSILSDPTLTATLDLNRPVGLILVAVLHFVPGAGAAQPILRRLLDAVPSGSYVAATHVTQDFVDQDTKDRYWRMYHAGKADIWPRSRDEFAGSMTGLDLVEPGIVQVHQWRPPYGGEIRTPEEVGIWGVVARKP